MWIVFDGFDNYTYNNHDVAMNSILCEMCHKLVQ